MLGEYCISLSHIFQCNARLHFYNVFKFDFELVLFFLTYFFIFLRISTHSCGSFDSFMTASGVWFYVFLFFFWLRAGLGTRNGSREVGQPATGVAISIGLGFGISAFSFWPLARVYRTFQLSYKTHAQARFFGSFSCPICLPAVCELRIPHSHCPKSTPDHRSPWPSS